MGDFSKFFQPKSIAFVGATADESKLGGRRFRSLVEGNFKGEIFPVNPGAKSIRGIPAFRNLREIPSAVDLAVIVVPTDAVLPTIDDCTTMKIPAVMLISAGFGEVNQQGQEIEFSIVEKIRSVGGRMLGPNCAGLFSGSAGINLGGATVPHGEIALISQSGNLLLDFNLRALEAGLGFSRQVAIGNAADVDGVALIADCLDDPDTSVVLAYMEGWKEGRGRALYELVRDHPEKKP
ncbi:MAG: CoA-binding protein, partial [Pseudomonadota bacterium]|nr:CoA-binding protein [Pseudomonadota bacterium]